MNTDLIVVKTPTQTKIKAKKLANDLGLSLSGLVNALLKQVIRDKGVTLRIREKPSQYLLDALKQSEEDIKAGRVSPSFDNAKDAIAWLENPKRKYQNEY